MGASLVVTRRRGAARQERVEWTAARGCERPETSAWVASPVNRDERRPWDLDHVTLPMATGIPTSGRRRTASRSGAVLALAERRFPPIPSSKMFHQRVAHAWCVLDAYRSRAHARIAECEYHRRLLRAPVVAVRPDIALDVGAVRH